MTDSDDTVMHGSDLRDAGTADPPPPDNREERKLRDLGHLPSADHPCFDPNLKFVFSATRGLLESEIDDFVAEEARCCPGPGGADSCIMHVQTTKVRSQPARLLVTVSFYRRREGPPVPARAASVTAGRDLP